MSETKEITFRKYKSSDRKILASMMNDTWKFDTYDVGCKNPDRIVNLIFDDYLYNSSYTQVALQDETHLGFLFAKESKFTFKTIISKIKYFFFLIKFSFLYLIGYYGNRKELSKGIKSFINSEKEMKRDAFKNKEDLKNSAEAMCFFVDEKARGLGIGTKLLDNFTEFCKENKIKMIWLITDTDCNYHYYDAKKFTVASSQKGIIGETAESNGKSFLYFKKL